MSTSESPVWTFNFLPKLWSFQVDGTLANFMITMKENWTNKMSASTSQKQALFTCKLSSWACRTQLQPLPACTQQGRKQENRLQGSALLFGLSGPPHLHWFQGSFLTSSCPKTAFWLSLSLGLIEIHSWPVRSHSCTDTLDSELGPHHMGPHVPKIDNSTHEYIAKSTTSQPHPIPKLNFILHCPPSGFSQLADHFIFLCYNAYVPKLLFFFF